jgi:hypothetical protein
MSKCQIIQTERLRDAQRAERAMFDVLARLPEDYFLYRELKVTPAYKEQLRGSMEVKPDMVVVGPDVGVLAFEVKDWNLHRNTYEWVDQYRIRVRRADGNVDIIGNPSDQADRYQHALRALLRGLDVFVQCFVAFPRITRQEFLNKFQDLTVISNPQSRFFLDMNRTVFKDDLAMNPLQPQEFLIRLARRHEGFRSSGSSEVLRVNQALVPTTFCIGDALTRQKGREALRLLSDEQQRWVFGMDDTKNYLLDVAGSGKTNILISKALHLVEKAPDSKPPTILLTTYSTNLETNIRRIFAAKLAASGGDHKTSSQAITIMGMPSLTKAIVKRGSGGDLAERAPDEGEDAYETRLKDWAADVLENDPSRFARFDYVLIDEIQDFDDTHLYILTKLCRGGRYLFVGDVGQKIYERSHDLKRHGIVTAPLELDRSFRMYRTPKYIAQLAIEFVSIDPSVQNEFQQQGYGTPQCANNSPNLAVLDSTNNPNISVAETVGNLLARDYVERDILIITSIEKTAATCTALETAGLAFSLGETEQGNTITVVDFLSAKGLERPVVIISGIEDLPCRGTVNNPFADEDSAARAESLSRRQLYVALTRTIETLWVFYSSNEHPFVKDLLEINRRILKKFQKRVRHGQ